jgi:hypothetical protein
MPDLDIASALAELDIDAELASLESPAPDPRVVAEQERLSEPSFLERVMVSGVNHAADTSGRAAAGMGLGLLGKAAPYVPGIVQKAGKLLGNPMVGSAIGAAEGARHGGLTGAVTGGVTGYGGSKAANMLAGKFGGPNVAAGMSRAGQAAQQSEALRQYPALDALMRGAPYDELAGIATAAKAGTKVAPAVTKATSLVDEVAARQKLANPIDWRTTDVTPIKKPGKGIHFGEESTPGLLKMLQDAQLAKDATLAEKIKKAISQRSHITGKVGS